MSVGPVRRRIRQERMQRRILGQAVAQLLQVEDASGLIHAFTRAVDRRQQGQGARDEDAGGDGEVSPAKRQAGRHLVEQAHRPPAIPRDERDRPPGQVREDVQTRTRRPASRWTASRRRSRRAVCSGSRCRAWSSRSRSDSSACTGRFRSSLRRSWRHSSPSRLARPRHLLKFFQRGVQARLHGSDRNLENLGDFTVFEVLVIRQDQGLPKSIGQASDALSNPLLPLGFLKFRQRPELSLTSKSIRFPASDSLFAELMR